MQITLSSDERSLLVETLEAALRVTREEVRHTDTPEYKDGLKRDEAKIRAILEKLRAAT